MKLLKRTAGLFLSVLLIMSLCPGTRVFAAQEKEITILFTHDLHSHFMPQMTQDGKESGGYARLMTL